MKALSTHSNTVQTRQWQPTPVLLPGESQGRGSLVSCWTRLKRLSSSSSSNTVREACLVLPTLSAVEEQRHIDLMGEWICTKSPSWQEQSQIAAQAREKQPGVVSDPQSGIECSVWCTLDQKADQPLHPHETLLWIGIQIEHSVS